jgi:Fe2+ transport system protein FeoA
MAAPGEDVRLIEIHGGQQLRQRLADLGLNTGMATRVVHAGNGGLILDIKGSRLVIGFGMALKIMVEPVTADSQ